MMRWTFAVQFSWRTDLLQGQRATFVVGTAGSEKNGLQQLSVVAQGEMLDPIGTNSG